MVQGVLRVHSARQRQLVSATTAGSWSSCCAASHVAACVLPGRERRNIGAGALLVACFCGGRQSCNQRLCPKTLRVEHSSMHTIKVCTPVCQQWHYPTGAIVGMLGIEEEDAVHTDECGPDDRMSPAKLAEQLLVMSSFCEGADKTLCLMVSAALCPQQQNASTHICSG